MPKRKRVAEPEVVEVDVGTLQPKDEPVDVPSDMVIATIEEVPLPENEAKIEEDDGHIKCPLCNDFKAKTHSELIDHKERKHHVYQCRDCKKYHNYEGAKMLCEKKHSNQLTRYKCDKCDAMFQNRSSLMKHVIIPHDLLECKKCGLKFTQM